MKITLMSFICLSVFLLSDCSKNYVQAPLEKDVTSINYRYFNMANSANLFVFRDSIRLSYVNAMKYPLEKHDTLINCNTTQLLGILHLIPLNDFWNMVDVAEDPRLQDGSKIILTITGYERADNSIVQNRNIISKTVRFPVSSEPLVLKESLQKIDSLFQILKPK